MAYFKLSAPARIYQYPFDYHSHLGGILPVRDAGGISLVHWLGNTDADRGEQLLFDQSLQFMLTANPFEVLLQSGERTTYERGECAAENIYIACVLIAQRFRPGEGVDELPVTDKRLYLATQETIRAVLTRQGPEYAWINALMRYFNGKTYASNKFTPFDDAYKTRSSMVDRVRKPQGGEAKYEKWIDDTLEYLFKQGILHIQIPAGRDDIPALDNRIQKFNGDHSTSYRALVHTSLAYQEDKKLAADLGKILELLSNKDKPLPATIGIDLLGVENRVAYYGTLFEFLQKNEAAISSLVGGMQSDHFIVHVHNGEGASAAADHRSLIGYYMAYGQRVPDASFYQAMAAYIRRCAVAARERQSTEGHGSRGAAGLRRAFSRLFDELFLSNSLTHQGCHLRRFDINGERSRALAAYNGKRNVMALSEALDAPSGVDGETWYDTLTAPDGPYVFRLGHDYYYRSYMAQKYPVIAFDTNLGSNAITGAAGLFGSGEAYRINKGFRHLDGYIDTDVIAAVSAAVANMSSDALTQEQIEYFLDTSRKEDGIRQVLADGEVKKEISEYLRVALGPVAGESGQFDERYYEMYSEIVIEIVDVSDQPTVRYQALTRVFALFQNWRSYLLGADGQGAEHSNIQDEFLRMVILVAYNLLPVGHRQLLEDTLEKVQEVMIVFAVRYWEATVGKTRLKPTRSDREIEKLDGYQSAASVVSLQRAPAAAGS